ncbi:MAG: hypothetical protein K9N11_09840, partial [Lentisphaeria bacterium]|nr:hypothetical protein [Candidatus Neomarinimicrobiota bacterium]MCF7843134.1 hypothetical protein [Lentisphaeria bacterium]
LLNWMEGIRSTVLHVQVDKFYLRAYLHYIMAVTAVLFYLSGTVVILFPEFDGQNDWSVFLFKASEWSGTLLSDPPEGHLAWLSKQEIAEIPLWEGDRIFLPWLNEPGIFSAVFYYKQKRLQRYAVTWHN